MPNAAAIAAQAVRGLPFPLIVSNHSDPVLEYTNDRLSSYSSDRWDVFFRNRAPDLASVNTVLAPEFVSFFPSRVQTKTVVIPNAVSPVQTVKTSSGNGSVENGLILAVGRLEKVKNHALAIQALHRLKDRRPGWRMKIFGCGPLQEQLQNMIYDLGVQDRVFLMGTTAEIGEQYRQADLLAFPSVIEGFGLVLTEAMAHGVPAVVLEECVPCARFVRESRAGFCAAADPADFAAKLEMLISDQALRKAMGLRARDYVKQFAPEIIHDQWERLFFDVV